MTGLNPLAVWDDDDCPYVGVSWPDYASGANDRLDTLRPLIAAAAELADAVVDPDTFPDHALVLARRILDLTTPKGDTP